MNVPRQVDMWATVSCNVGHAQQCPGTVPLRPAVMCLNKRSLLCILARCHYFVDVDWETSETLLCILCNGQLRSLLLTGHFAFCSISLCVNPRKVSDTPKGEVPAKATSAHAERVAQSSHGRKALAFLPNDAQ